MIIWALGRARTCNLASYVEPDKKNGSSHFVFSFCEAIKASPELVIQPIGVCF